MEEIDKFIGQSNKDISVPEFDRLVANAHRQNLKIKRMEACVQEEKTKLQKMRNSLMAYLEEFGKDKYTNDAGTIYIQNDFQCSVPKDPENKKLMFEWMQERGLFDKYATVNSVSFKSLYKSLLESEGFDFKMPGMEMEPTVFPMLKLKGSKEVDIG